MLNSIIHMITNPNGYIVYFVALIISIFLKFIIEKKDGEKFITFTKNIFVKN